MDLFIDIPTRLCVVLLADSVHFAPKARSNSG